MVSDLPQPEKHRQNAVEAFASGLTDSVASPINGAVELFGGPKSSRRAANADSQENSTAHSAGEMLGSALVFIATTAAVKRFLPGAGRFAPIAAGGMLGGLSETPNGTLGERLTNAALGAGTVSLLEFAPGGLNRLGVTNKLGQLAVANSAAGMFNTQAESFLKTGHAASFGDTVMGAGTWTATSMAFAGGGKLFESALSKPNPALSSTKPSEATVNAYRSQFVELPGLKLGEPGSPASTIEVAAQSDLAKMYEQAKNGVGRIEVLAYGQQGGLEGRHGTGFSIDDKGRMLTANHVTEGAVDISVFDKNGQVHKASLLGAAEDPDLAVIKFKNQSSFTAFDPLPLAADSGAAPNQNAVAFGHPNGWRDLFASPGNEKQSPRPFWRINFSMHGDHGISGGPIMTPDGVKAVFVQGSRTSIFDSTGTPIHQAESLLQRLDRMNSVAANDVPATAKPRLDLQMIRTFDINNKPAATANLSKLFGEDFTTDRAPDFFHSKVKTVDMPGTESGALTMSMQYRPAEHKVVISPIAIDKAPISADAQWPASKLGIAQSRLEVHLGTDGTPLKMVSYNDPYNVLQEGFNYRGTNNYLAMLQQRRTPTWMRLLPQALRFERLAVGS